MRLLSSESGEESSLEARLLSSAVGFSRLCVPLSAIRASRFLTGLMLISKVMVGGMPY